MLTKILSNAENGRIGRGRKNEKGTEFLSAAITYYQKKRRLYLFSDQTTTVRQQPPTSGSNDDTGGNTRTQGVHEAKAEISDRSTKKFVQQGGRNSRIFKNATEKNEGKKED